MIRSVPMSPIIPFRFKSSVVVVVMARTKRNPKQQYRNKNTTCCTRTVSLHSLENCYAVKAELEELAPVTLGEPYTTERRVYQDSLKESWKGNRIRLIVRSGQKKHFLFCYKRCARGFLSLFWQICMHLLLFEKKNSFVAENGDEMGPAIHDVITGP